MFTSTDAGDPEYGYDVSGVARPRPIWRTDSDTRAVCESDQARRERKKAEEAEWAEKCGPVVVRKAPTQ